ncbi:right-handed parallel beta-helix repeat-containing protein [Klebsiella pneumoniae]|uniref:right-handed parallel beta-helix repeat-containing protein n=2 Tax=Klebsiella pneumoniae TaxID=573 RepID=UPI0020CF938A|nr:right-handed parallel beta-helix repeat-containing protein [Klebsiella pneumoniae]MCQ0566547.1 right-handed parallel beta-helix repeat-containing protein [Klebsiella pneumoniae]MCQ0605842.1 right-handed parallel beta-helix repeat-containing protein [Klebsiella pneumoniae]
MAFTPPLGSTSPEVLLGNATRLDELVNGPAATVPDRGGDPLDSWRLIKAKNDEAIEDARKNITLLGLPFTTREEAQAAADEGKIPVGGITWVRNAGDASLADEYINNAGTLEATGRKMPSQNHIDQMIGLSDNGNIAVQTDLEGQVVTVTDDFGGIHIPGLPDSIQGLIDFIGKNLAPDIFTIGDLLGNHCVSVDDFAHVNISGMKSSVPDMFKAQNKYIKQLLNERRVINLKSLGLDLSTGENALQILQLAVNLGNAAGGAVVYAPEAEYPLSGSVEWKDNVYLLGAGIGKTILKPYKSAAALRYIGKSGNTITYLNNVRISDLTIDGSEQVAPESGYIPDIKGIFFQYYSNVIFDRLEIMNTGATGLGVDFPDKVWINKVITRNCGRLGTDTATGLPASMDTPILQRPLGASGIGLGTGAQDYEPIFVTNTVNLDNMNFGIFFEPQSNGAAKGAFCVNNFCARNFGGIADCGIDGLLTTGNILDSNKHNFLLYPGTNLGGKPGRNGIFSCNTLTNSLSHNVYSYTHKSDYLAGGYSFTGNKFQKSGGDHINHRYTNTNPQVKIIRIKIKDNEFDEAARHTVHFEAGNIMIACKVNDNTVFGSGQQQSGDGVNSKVAMYGCSIKNNTIMDILQSVPTQQYPVSLSGDLTDVDISMNHCVGNVKNLINLTGVQTRVTVRMNPGSENGNS